MNLISGDDGKYYNDKKKRFKDEEENRVISWDANPPTGQMLKELYLQMEGVLFKTIRFSLESHAELPDKFEALKKLFTFNIKTTKDNLDLILKFIIYCCFQNQIHLKIYALECLTRISIKLSESHYSMEKPEPKYIMWHLLHFGRDENEHVRWCCREILKHLRNISNISSYLATSLSSSNDMEVKIFYLNELRFYLLFKSFDPNEQDAALQSICSQVSSTTERLTTDETYLSLMAVDLIFNVCIAKGPEFVVSIRDLNNVLEAESLGNIASLWQRDLSIKHLSDLLCNPNINSIRQFEPQFLKDSHFLKCCGKFICMMMFNEYQEKFFNLTIVLIKKIIKSQEMFRLMFQEAVQDKFNKFLLCSSKFSGNMNEQKQQDENTQFRAGFLKLSKILFELYKKQIVSEDFICTCLNNLVKLGSDLSMELTFHVLDNIGFQLQEDKANLDTLFQDIMSKLKKFNQETLSMVNFLLIRKQHNWNEKDYYLQKDKTPVLRLNINEKFLNNERLVKFFDSNNLPLPPFGLSRTENINLEDFLMRIDLRKSQLIIDFTLVMDYFPPLRFEDRGGAIILSPDLTKVLTIKGAVHNKIGLPKGQFEIPDVDLKMTSKRETLEEGKFYIGELIHERHYIDVFRSDNLRKMRFYVVIAKSLELKSTNSSDDVCHQE